MFKKILLGSLGVALLAACTTDGELSNIVWRKLTWESYISGDDIKASCHEEAGEVYRYVYNANRAKSVLIYNWSQSSEELKFERLKPIIVIEEDTRLDKHILETLLDPKKETYPLTQLHLGTLSELTSNDLSRDSLEIGERVTTASHFLTIAACRNGVFDLQVIPQEGLQQSFPKTLSYLISTSLPEEARPVLPLSKALKNSKLLEDQSDEDNFNHYDIILEEDGLQFGRTYPFK